MVADLVVSAAYRAQQLSLFVPAIAAQQSMRLIARNRTTVPAEALAIMRARYRALLARDLDNAARGLYPRSLLFQFPLRDYARAVPALLRDVPRTVRRSKVRNHRDLPASAHPERYPKYFQRNFHWQTDGYLSRRSADLYDVGVELLFLGVADVMRRQIIPPVTREIARRGDRKASVLDVACGTGRALRQLGLAHPELSLTGLDLSPFYIDKARELLGDEVRLVADNAEAMPFGDGAFEIVTSVYLFHELPRDARRRVLAEMHRVLAPGGLVVIEDSVQRSDSPELAPFIDRFSVDFHEPYYKGYLDDDLATALGECGFRVEAEETHFASKVVVARRA